MKPFDQSFEANSLLLIGAGVILPALAAKAGRAGMARAYEAVADCPPPRNPADPAVAWKDALAWSIAGGVAGGVLRLAVRRLLAETAVPPDVTGEKDH